MDKQALSILHGLLIAYNKSIEGKDKSIEAYIIEQSLNLIGHYDRALDEMDDMRKDLGYTMHKDKGNVTPDKDIEGKDSIWQGKGKIIQGFFIDDKRIEIIDDLLHSRMITNEEIKAYVNQIDAKE